ncbi:MAG: hypothetical protein K9K76_11870, partial [Halanaerobiales bacterium]|nr:hypothetical protein [Halanaerobiales bacterium]
MVQEDESVLLQVFENNSYLSTSNYSIYLKLKDLEKEIWGVIYQCSTKDYLIVFNENYNGKIMRGVYYEALEIIDSNLSFIDSRIVVIKEDNF